MPKASENDDCTDVRKEEDRRRNTGDLSEIQASFQRIKDTGNQNDEAHSSRRKIGSG